MFEFAILLLLAGPPRHLWLYGTVRAGDSGEPVAGALVEVPDEHLRTWSDSGGDYRLQVSEGAHLLRVWRPGFEARTLGVLAGTDSAMRLDISLTPRPVLLSEVGVVDSTPRAPAPDSNAWVGSRSFSRDRLYGDPAVADADVLQELAAAPGVVVAPELPTAVHVRGGSADQNLILLDGVPLYSPYHAGGVLGAVNPDAVSSVTVDAGVAPPRFGDAVSGIVAIRTRKPGPGRLSSRGAVGPLALRETVGGPLPGLPGTFLVSGRHSTADLLAGPGNQANSYAGFGDLFVNGTLDLGSGDLEIFSFISGDHLGFDARPGGDASGLPAAADSGASGALQATDSLTPRNGFSWSTGTQALVWRSDRASPTRLEARAWRTRFDATAAWAADSGPVRLASALTNTGVGADVSWRLSSALATAGFSAERTQTRYAVRSLRVPASGDTVPGLAALASSPLVLAAFIEDRWQVGPRWTFAAGVRDQIVSGGAPELEPRASVRFTPLPWLAVSAGYARMHQSVQSLRNEESILDAMVGVGFPVAAGASGAPVARSDQLALAAAAQLAAGTTLALDWYTRRLAGLVLVAPATAQPFVMEHFARGTGHASGVTVSLGHSGGRLFGHAAYAFAVTSRAAGDQRYQPSFTSAHSLAIAAGYRLTPVTTLRAAFWATTGRPTSIVGGGLDGAPYALLLGTGDLAGSPQRIVGALNVARLPPYARLDLGIRREWRASLFGRSAGFTGSLTVGNVFGRQNALGTVLSGDGRTLQAIPMQPRLVTLGFAWSY